MFPDLPTVHFCMQKLDCEKAQEQNLVFLMFTVVIYCCCCYCCCLLLLLFIIAVVIVVYCYYCLSLLLLLLFTVIVVCCRHCCLLLLLFAVTTQMFAIIVVLGLGKLLGLVNIPDPNRDQLKRVRPSHYTVTISTSMVTLSDGVFHHRRCSPFRYFTFQISFLAWEAPRV